MSLIPRLVSDPLTRCARVLHSAGWFQMRRRADALGRGRSVTVVPRVPTDTGPQCTLALRRRSWRGEKPAEDAQGIGRDAVRVG